MTGKISFGLIAIYIFYLYLDPKKCSNKISLGTSDNLNTNWIFHKRRAILNNLNIIVEIWYASMRVFTNNINTEPLNMKVYDP